MQYEIAFLFSLLFTVIIETIILLILAICLKLKNGKIELIFLGIIASSLTLPYLWFVLPFFLQSYLVYVIVGEISVTLIEALFYMFVLKTSFKDALILSVVCNAVSFCLGLIIF